MTSVTPAVDGLEVARALAIDGPPPAEHGTAVGDPRPVAARRASLALRLATDGAGGVGYLLKDHGSRRLRRRHRADRSPPWRLKILEVR